LCELETPGSVAGMTRDWSRIPPALVPQYRRLYDLAAETRRLLGLPRERPQLTVIEGAATAISEPRSARPGAPGDRSDHPDDSEDVAPSGGEPTGDLVRRHLRVVRELAEDVLE
jgi:hypothetical protein